MDEQPYPFKTDDSAFVYYFESRSASKLIQKVVSITETKQVGIFNLALLDKVETGELSDTSVSDNNDMITVLATVFKIVANFLDRFPGPSLVF